jgi:hypothetical protein
MSEHTPSPRRRILGLTVRQMLWAVWGVQILCGLTALVAAHTMISNYLEPELPKAVFSAALVGIILAAFGALLLTVDSKLLTVIFFLVTYLFLGPFGIAAEVLAGIFFLISVMEKKKILLVAVVIALTVSTAAFMALAIAATFIWPAIGTIIGSLIATAGTAIIYGCSFKMTQIALGRLYTD